MLARCPTEEDAYRLRCIGLLLLVPMVPDYTRKVLLHEAARVYGDDPLYLQLKEESLDEEGVVQRLREEGKRLWHHHPLVPPDDVI